jgi:hypothetical protein
MRRFLKLLVHGRLMWSTTISVLLLTLALHSSCVKVDTPKQTPQTKSSEAQLSTPATDTVRNTASIAVGATSARTSNGFSEADFARHVKELHTRIKTKLSSNQFSIVVQPPFVVVGDEPESMVIERANDTVKWAVDRLKQDFFSKDPDVILEIWLFKDDESYRKNTRLMFGDVPSTPYGYYSRTHKALIMNIGTGGGTLVHEIVHPFIEANFPACPSWLNEGLGSLYEQCGDVSGHIHGFTNWRLPGLQKAIRDSRVPSFKELLEMDARAFYNDTSGVHYAQSRYLCYYLQEKGLLVKFYKEFLAKQTEDPSGFKSLQRVLGEADMDAFKRRWENYVLGLRQGYSVTVE